MPLESTPAGIASDGNGLLVFATTIADTSAPTVVAFNAGTKLTYSITADGYSHTVNENTVTANRLTLAQTLQYAGTITDEIELTYAVKYIAGDVARLLLVPGTTGYLIERWGIANSTAGAAAQLVTVIPVTAGIQRPNAPVSNQELTMSQKFFVTGTVTRQVALV